MARRRVAHGAQQRRGQSRRVAVVDKSTVGALLDLDEGECVVDGVIGGISLVTGGEQGLDGEHGRVQVGFVVGSTRRGLHVSVGVLGVRAPETAVVALLGEQPTNRLFRHAVGCGRQGEDVDGVPDAVGEVVAVGGVGQVIGEPAGQGTGGVHAVTDLGLQVESAHREVHVPHDREKHEFAERARIPVLGNSSGHVVRRVRNHEVGRRFGFRVAAPSAHAQSE